MMPRCRSLDADVTGARSRGDLAVRHALAVP